MFIAKISRGRTLREFVTTVVLVPSAIVIAWFVVSGSTAIWLTMRGEDLRSGGTNEEVLFKLLQRLPLGFITSIVAMVAVVILFVTAADSASIVMASTSQGGRPEPSKRVTILWGLLLGLIAIALLLAGGQTAISGLQSLMVVSALPFAFVVIGIMYSWARDLLTDWYVEATSTDPRSAVTADNVRRTLEPGRIQSHGEGLPERTSSGEASQTVGGAGGVPATPRLSVRRTGRSSLSRRCAGGAAPRRGRGVPRSCRRPHPSGGDARERRAAAR